MTTSFKLNNEQVQVSVPSDTPLLWVIRDTLNITGTKFGCGIGLCGACTVHVNGRAVRSCITAVGDVARAEVVTIEGLDPAGDHPVQRAWIDVQAPQCGYCQSGQIMQAVAFLKDFSNPTDEDIDEVMSGNLCRCMAYLRIKKAIKKAAQEMQG